MFEGKPPVPPAANGLNSGDFADDGLCAMDWSELVAKLSAARDLRAELEDEGTGALASFDPDHAAHVASHHERLPVDGKPDVNPDDLVNRKQPGGIVAGHSKRNDPANRGNS